jgi:hypothetical protein
MCAFTRRCFASCTNSIHPIDGSHVYLLMQQTCIITAIRREPLTLNKVLQRELHSLTFKPYPSAERRYYNALCADGKFRGCKRVLAAWLADCPEYSDLYHLERHVCFWCHCLQNELGDYVPLDKHHPQRDHNLYRMLSNANTKAADAELWSRHVHQAFDVV